MSVLIVFVWTGPEALVFVLVLEKVQWSLIILGNCGPRFFLPVVFLESSWILLLYAKHSESGEILTF